MKISYVTQTDVGIKRDLNEDYYGAIPEKSIFFICDGMGGHAAGDFASQTSAETIEQLFKDSSQEDWEKITIAGPAEISLQSRRIASAIITANRRLFKLQVMYPKIRGMGTTFCGISFQNGLCNIFNVGDSRTYRFRGNNLEQLTVDHSWVEEMLQDGDISAKDLDTFGGRNVITRALGTNPLVQVDWKTVSPMIGDIFLICTDGLYEEIDDSQIQHILETFGSNLEVAAEKLIQAAKEAGGSDNITVTLARVDETTAATPAGAIQPTIKALDADESTIQMIDRHIDKYMPPAKTKVPAGVVREKRKLYQIPLVQVIGILAIMTAGALLISRPWNKVVPEEAAATTTGDILLSTMPGAADVSLYLDDQLITTTRAPASFLSLEEGTYSIRVLLDGYQPESFQINVIKGEQIVREVQLRAQAELRLTLGMSPGFNNEEKIYLNGETWDYFGSPLTVRRVGVVGKSIHITRDKDYALRVGNIERTFRLNQNEESITLTLDQGKMLIER
ncbi:MAG: SpoIIE family protein phosphatase [Elusimicrobia bacterium]|nr:SpoIIE family protein phosphatase [Elusimicrobiota bacterium]